MNWSRILRLLGVLVLLVIGLAALPSVATPNSKIEPALLEKLAAERTADFIVRFGEQADLSPAYQMGWKERGEFVVRALTEVAERSQATAKTYLDGRGIAYRTFIAGNELYVWSGDLAAANRLAEFPEVAFIRATRTYYVDPIISNETNAAPHALDWGILDTGADDFWAAFGVQGDGIVVANIDTGVQWNHPALDQAYKCASNPTSPACWYDPSSICGGTVCDNNGHGTHTMGTMVGDDDPSLAYQVGMAPNALWIACKGCETNSCSDFALNACADWILQPDGNPANRPHVVNNSWGGGGCDTWYQAKVQAWRAAGIFPAFSAGNSGSGCGTLGSPGDYQESFASAAHDVSRNIASFSSRGPSCFGHDPYTKPNISAPGVNVCSSVPTNAWSCTYSGTSMASPHSAGAVALLWSCNPSLIGQIDLTFEALQNTADTPPAGNCNAPPDGEGNYTYGYGYLNVYQAGLQYCGGVALGYLQGHVYDADTGSPIGGANVIAVPGGQILAVTDPTGYYTMSLVPGVYDVTASKNGYDSQTVQDIHIYTDTVTTQDFQLHFLGQWTLLPDNPFDYTRFDCVWFDDGTGPSAYNQKVYCLGGRTGSTTEDPSIWRFDPVTQVWTDTGHDVYEDVSNYTANLLRDENYDTQGLAIYIVGGYDAEGGGYMPIVQRYYPKTGLAQNVPDDPWPVMVGGYNTIPGACVSTSDLTKIYCFGAWESNAAPYFSAQTWEYDPTRPDTQRWQQITTANLSVPRGYILAAVQGTKIYAIGGDYQYTGGDLVPTDIVEVLDVTNLAAGWSTVASMPIPLSQGRAFGLDVDTLGVNVPVGKIYTAGGGDWPNETTEAMEYDVASDTWNQAFPDLNIARRNHAGVYIPLCTPDDPTDLMPSLLVVGGRSGSDVPPYPQPEYFPFSCSICEPVEILSVITTTEGCVVSFSAEVTGTEPIDFLWDFGPFGTTTETNPIVDFQASGTYAYTLTVSNCGGTDSWSGTVTVECAPPMWEIYLPVVFKAYEP